MAFNRDDYETVETRIFKFWDRYPNGRIITRLEAHTDTDYIVAAAIYRDTDAEIPFATGLAQETVGTSQVNKTSALENCETSAIGRALANGGFATKGARPSREEMEKAHRDDAAIEAVGAPVQTIRRRPGSLTPAGQTGLLKLEQIAAITEPAERITKVAQWKAVAADQGVLDETTMVNGSLVTLARYADAVATGTLLPQS